MNPTKAEMQAYNKAGLELCQDLVRRVPEWRPIFDGDEYRDAEVRYGDDRGFYAGSFLWDRFQELKHHAKSDSRHAQDILRRYLEWAEDHIDSPNEQVANIIGLEFCESLYYDEEMQRLIRYRLGPKCLADLKEWELGMELHYMEKPKDPWYKRWFRSNLEILEPKNHEPDPATLQKATSLCQDLVRHVPEMQPLLDDPGLWWPDDVSEDRGIIGYAFFVHVYEVIERHAFSESAASADTVQRYLDWVENHIDHPDEYVNSVVWFNFCENLRYDKEMQGLLRHRLPPRLLADLEEFEEYERQAEELVRQNENGPWYKRFFRRLRGLPKPDRS